MLTIFASMRVDYDVAASGMLVMCEFLKILMTCLQDMKLSSSYILYLVPYLFRWNHT